MMNAQFINNTPMIPQNREEAVQPRNKYDIEKRIRPDLLKDVVDLECDGEIVTLPISMYNDMSRTKSDYGIFMEISRFHDEVDRL
jgi:hypothetical protein